MTCECKLSGHEPRLVVLTGGPGAGKTAVLETIRRNFCEHVVVLPEAASIVFGGGFPRGSTLSMRCAAQRAIFHIQRQLERAVVDAREAAVVLCDRGTLDGLAYWPLVEETLWADVHSSAAEELARYAAVIHLRTPPLERGYDHTNPLRIESATEAAAVDARIYDAWARHPRRHVVESDAEFLKKLAHAVELVREEVPPCCRSHRIAEVDSVAVPPRS